MTGGNIIQHGPGAQAAEIAVLLLAGVAATAFFTLAPALIGALIDRMHLPVSAVGWIASCQLAGSALGNVCALLLGRKLSVRHTLTASLAAAGLINLATLLAHDLAALLVFCFASGIAGGMAYSVVNAVAARLPRPGVMFAGISIAQMLFGSIGFIALPALVAAYGPGAIFATLGSYSLACAVGALLFTGPAPIHDSGWRASLSMSPRGAVLLVALFATFLTSTAIWTHLERIGVAARLHAGVISLGLSMGMLAGILGAVGAAVVLLRRRHPDHILVGGAILLAISTALLIKSSSPAAYLVALCGFSGAQSLIVPLYLARLAAENGGDARVLVALLAMYLGLIGGPLLGTSLVVGLDYQLLILVAAASLAVASILTLGARRRTPQLVTP